MLALSYSYYQTIMKNEIAIEVTESVAVEYTKVNHTLLHEAEFAGRIKNAAGTLRVNQTLQKVSKPTKGK